MFLLSQKPLFLKGPQGLLLQAIYTGKTLFLLGTKEPFQKKRLLAYKEHLKYNALNKKWTELENEDEVEP